MKFKIELKNHFVKAFLIKLSYKTIYFPFYFNNYSIFD